MKTMAALLTLVLVSSALAGCTGDPDGGGNDEIDSDALQNLFDEHFQDFLNNTTITVNNHYHNNTTISSTSTDNSVSNINGSGIGSDSVMNMFTVSWDRESELIGYDPMDVMIAVGNNSNDPTLLYADYYNGQVIEFRLSCIEYLNFDRLEHDNWMTWLVDNYGVGGNNNSSGGSGGSAERLNVAHRIMSNIFYSSDVGNRIEEFCRIDEYLQTPRITLFEIDLSVGEAMSIQVLPGNVVVDLNCDDGYGTGNGNGTSTTYIGGQANCTVTGSTIGHWRLYVTNWLLDENGDNVQFYNNNLYDWYLDYSGIAPANFAVYFTMHYVEVYDLDSE